MTAEPICVRVDSDRGKTLVLRGEFDSSTKQALRDALRRVIAEAHSRAYVDLSGVTFFDSCSVAELLWANRRAPQLGAELVLVAPSPVCRLVVETLGLEPVFKIVEE